MSAMSKTEARSGVVIVACLVAVMAGCSTQARREDCDGRLHPINGPAPVTALAPASPERNQPQ